MRIIEPSKTFLASRERLAPRGSPAYAAVVLVLRSLMDETRPLVGPEDRSVRRGVLVMGRPAPGTDLVVCYVPGGDAVTVVDLIRG